MLLHDARTVSSTVSLGNIVIPNTASYDVLISGQTRACVGVRNIDSLEAACKALGSEKGNSGQSTLGYSDASCSDKSG